MHERMNVCLFVVCLYVYMSVCMYDRLTFFDTFWCHYHGSYLIIIGLICTHILYAYWIFIQFFGWQSSNFQQYVSSRQNLWMNRVVRSCFELWNFEGTPQNRYHIFKSCKTDRGPPHIWWCQFPETSNFVRSSCDAALWVLIGTMTKSRKLFFQNSWHLHVKTYKHHVQKNAQIFYRRRYLYVLITRWISIADSRFLEVSITLSSGPKRLCGCVGVLEEKGGI